MSLTVQNSKSLITEKMKWKVLIVGPPGAGKTTWISTAPNPGVAACETGFGGGLLSVAQSGLDFVEPKTVPEFEAVCTGGIFKDKETIAIDSLTAMSRTFIKAHALAQPAQRGTRSPAMRLMGVPEGYDYQAMAETTRGLLSKLLEIDKHIIVTVGQKAIKDGDGNIIGLAPDLPGAMADAAPAMFDIVLYLKARKALADPTKKASEYTQRYFLSTVDGYHSGAKCRSVIDGTSLLSSEEVFDLKTGQGSFTSLYSKIQAAYKASAAPAIAKAVPAIPA